MVYFSDAGKLLCALVERGRLVETPDGLYGVVGGLRQARRETAGRPWPS